ncbi:FliH/SctL family protein [Cupriavidus sp. 8B]
MPQEALGAVSLATGYGREATKPDAQDSTTALPPAASAGGYEAGWRVGQQDGLALGKKEGYKAGLQIGKEDGHKQGLIEGRAAGQLEAQAIARREVGERLDQLDRLLSAIPSEIGARLDRAEGDMAALCFEVVCRMIGEAAVELEGVRCMVRNAVSQTASRRLVAIHVHPRDLEALQGDANLKTWLSGRNEEGRAPVQWIADDQVRLGGCIVRAPEGSLDARLETQLAVLHDVVSRRAMHQSQSSKSNSASTL